MRTTATFPFLLLVITTMAVADDAPAQSLSVDWHSIAGGGGPSIGGEFAISGTAGQPFVSPPPMAGGPFALTGGFWALFAVQTPGAPLLSIERQGGQIRVSWPLPATGMVLDESEAPTGGWSQVAFPYTTNAADISIRAPAPSGNKFYRLRKP